MSIEKNHKSHRIPKFKTFCKTYMFTKNVNSLLFIENFEFLKTNSLHSDLFNCSNYEYNCLD